MNIIDIVILVVLGVSVIFGMHRGFISGVLSVAALIGAALLSFSMSGELSAWLQGNQTLVDTLMYYTDAGSRVSNLDLSLLSISQVTENALSQILESANLPDAFESAFVGSIAGASGSMTIAQLLSQTIVSVSISILSFLCCFFVTYLAATFVINLVNYVFELPVLRHLDALACGVFGLLRGVLLLFIRFALVPLVLAIAPVPMISDLIEQSRLAPVFDSQLILSILRGAL